ncbi:MAG: diguanylate cyclase [Gammaproteobacteria bacterium]|nr:diguanylate cyclase [Gammaproteobacteria bacterium]
MFGCQLHNQNGWCRKWLPILLGAVTVLALLTLLRLWDLKQGDLAQQAAQITLHRDLSASRIHLEQAINKRIFLVYSLAAWVRTSPVLNQVYFERYAKVLLKEVSGVRSLQLAPHSVVTFIHPLKGNEAAVGHNLLADPKRAQVVRKTISEKRLLISGPVELRQTGRAIIARYPLFFPAVVGNLSADGYWGLAVILIDLDRLLDEVVLESQQAGVEIALRGVDGKGAEGALFWGAAELFEAESNSLLLAVNFPNGQWLLAGRPLEGWGGQWQGRTLFWTLGLLVVLLAGYLSHFLLASRNTTHTLLVTDSMTGLFNRRYFLSRAEQCIVAAQRSSQPFSMLLLDLDHFKQVNDRYGHESGDRVLIAVCQLLLKLIRDTDFAARIGGEEFCIVFPKTSVDEAWLTSERIRRAIEAEKISLSDGEVISVTISAGVADLTPNDAGDDLSQLMARADKALYEAKNSGRNRIKTAS